MNNGKNGSVHYQDYVAGWLDGSIGDIIELISPTSAMKFALITALDSDLAPGKLLATSPELKALGAAAKPLGAGIMVPTSLILDARIFFGFDEVWFFPHPRISPKPKSPWLVGPSRIDQAKLNKLGSWITENECSLAFGDGCGLNFLVKARGPARSLLAFSMLQPQSDEGGEEEAAPVPLGKVGS